MRDSDILRAAASLIRDSKTVYALVDQFYRDRDVDADAQDVSRSMDDAADLLDAAFQS